MSNELVQDIKEVESAKIVDSPSRDDTKKFPFIYTLIGTIIVCSGFWSAFAYCAYKVLFH